MAKGDDVDDTTAKRIGHNQSLYREINQSINGIAAARPPYEATWDFVCECGHTECNEAIPLSHQAYERVRQHPARFFVLAGHEIPGAEEVVEHHDGYIVVEKTGAAKQEAKAASWSTA